MTSPRGKGKRTSVYTKVGQFPKNYKHIRVGDPATFKATKHHAGWPKDKEVYGRIMGVYLNDENPYIIVAASPEFHSFGGTLFAIFPQGHPEFDFYLKIRDANLGTLLRQRAMQERKEAFQGNVLPLF